MIVVDFGELSSAASTTAIDLKDYGQYALTGRNAAFCWTASDDAVLTAELEEYVDGIENSAGTWASGTWTDVSGSQIAIAAGGIQWRIVQVTINEEYVRVTCSAYTSGKVRAALLFSN